MAKKSTGIAREVDKLGRVKVPGVPTIRLFPPEFRLYKIPLPSRVSINKAGELALEEEQSTGKIDLYNPNIVDTSLWDGFMEGIPYECYEVNGKPMEFYAVFTKAIVKQSNDKDYCLDGFYSEQGNNLAMLSESAKFMWYTSRWIKYLKRPGAVCDPYCEPVYTNAVYTMEQWERNGGFKGRAEGQEISYGVYNRFLQENQPTRSLPCRLPQNRDGAVNLEFEEGFMTTEPCAYAEVEGEQRLFYLMFSKRKDQYRGYFCKFEGVYSAQGDNIFDISLEKQNWISTEHILWRNHITPPPYSDWDYEIF